MTERTWWTRLKGFLGDLMGFVIEAGTALGRQLRRAGRWLRPRLSSLWERMRPRVLLALVWLAVRMQRARTVTTRVARVAWAWIVRTATRLRSGLLPRVRRPALMAARTALIALILGASCLGVLQLGLHRTPVGSIAVRQIEWGGSGVVEGDHGAGLHRTLRGRDAWYLLPAGTERIAFSGPEEGGTHQPLEVATLEGEACQVSVVVPYRVRPGSGWRLIADGLRLDYHERAVAICRRVLLEELGKLSAEAYADPSARNRVEEDALARLDIELGGAHLEPLDVCIGTLLFNATYEKKMLEKQLAEQDALKQEAVAMRKAQERENEAELHKLQDAEAQLIQLYAERKEKLRDAHDEGVRELARSAKADTARITSLSKVRVLEAKNAGELALAGAEDLRQRLHDEALESAGGPLHIAREAAENLRFGKVTLNSNDPRVPSVLDLDELVSLLMGKARGL
ncbi:MAG: SPFH domain-containing protein [Planctomycetota bacterium]|nr:SPFH domain-containing protein [Planctomycetota bacterium]